LILKNLENEKLSTIVKEKEFEVLKLKEQLIISERELSAAL